MQELWLKQRNGIGDKWFLTGSCLYNMGLKKDTMLQ